MDEVIYVDHSMLATHSTCEEKGRLGYIEHLRPNIVKPSLAFGGAFHAAVATYYMDGSVDAAKRAFHDYVKKTPGVLPLSADTDERRSVERGIYLIEAYAEKWKKMDAQWENIIRKDEPLIEIGFSVYFMDWKGVPVVCVGRIDRVRRNRVDGQAYVIDTKTSSGSVKFYSEATRPNHQLTTYKWACEELLGIQIAGGILDVVYVSERKMDGKYPRGINIDEDFGRFETRRSKVDVDEFLYDLKRKTTKFLELRDSGIRRGERNDSACRMYGGCHFRDACASNLNPAILRSKYKVEKWHPWASGDTALIIKDTSTIISNVNAHVVEGEGPSSSNVSSPVVG